MIYRILLLILLMAVSTTVFAGVYSQTKHGSPTIGVERIAGTPRGSCGQCHVEGSGKIKQEHGLWRENDNELCYTCHREENLTGIFPGQRVSQASTHEIDPRFIWPGPVPPVRQGLDEAGKCLSCHDPHGEKDRDGLIPSLLLAREENLCLACHDGDPSTRNTASDMRKPFSHAVRQSFGRHSADENGDPDRYSYVGNNRHVECSDCHNAHALYGDSAPPIAPDASNRNGWVGRVAVNNGGAGTIPTYEYLLAADTGSQVREYEICFKCHSSWTRQPPGQPDMARLFNPNNASYHPVEQQGRNLNIDPNAFVGGVSAFSTIYCSDCHGSEDSELRGPHGSQYANILRRPYEANSASRFVARDELCFLCHNFETYADSMGTSFSLQASRFNPPASPQGHAFHVGEMNTPCNACHNSHGSPQYGALIDTDRRPGLIQFNMNVNGGNCTATCHGSRNYSVNYPR
jgi:predicted CXXCH cytochrome family protein